MIRMLMVFAVLVFALHMGLTGWRALTGKERWNLTKSILYSIIVSLLAVTAMFFIVITF